MRQAASGRTSSGKTSGRVFAVDSVCSTGHLLSDSSLSELSLGEGRERQLQSLAGGHLLQPTHPAGDPLPLLRGRSLILPLHGVLMTRSPSLFHASPTPKNIPLLPGDGSLRRRWLLPSCFCFLLGGVCIRQASSSPPAPRNLTQPTLPQVWAHL